jgi:hypothetical protein
MKGKENPFFRDFSSFQRLKLTDRNVREGVSVATDTIFTGFPSGRRIG